MAIFRFLKMAAVCHLGFILRMFGPPTKSINLVVLITGQNLVEIGAIVLVARKFEYFVLSMKLPIHAPTPIKLFTWIRWQP